MQNFADKFGPITPGNATVRIQGGVRLDADLGAQVSKFVSHLSGRQTIDVGDELFFGDPRIQSRVNPQFAAGHELQFVGRSLRDDLRPLTYCALADSDRLGNGL